jgi:hypothetical protein
MASRSACAPREQPQDDGAIEIVPEAERARGLVTIGEPTVAAKPEATAPRRAPRRVRPRAAPRPRSLEGSVHFLMDPHHVHREP